MVMEFFPPWVASKDYVLSVPNGWASEAWRQVAPNIFCLEPRLTLEQFAMILRDSNCLVECYKPVYVAGTIAVAEGIERPFYTDKKVDGAAPISFWLDIEKCPPSERMRWPHFLEVLNLKEADGVMEAFELYEWKAENIRFVLRNKAWREGHERP